MKIARITDEELDAVAGGATDGGVGGVKGITQDELDAVAGGDTDGGVGGVKA